jgi:tRNA threonylcarbamoyladenosine biosynthesis protein TsaB
MRILAIGTSGSNCTVAITEDNKLIKEIDVKDGLTHSETLLPTMDLILKETNLSLDDIDYYATSIGPGSFTGIRIGISTIKGLCLGKEKPVVAVPTLLGLAYNVKDFKGYIVSCIDARNDNVYAKIFESDGTTIKDFSDYIVDNVDALISEIQKLDNPNIIVGDGANLIAEKLGINDSTAFANQDKNYEYASSIAASAFNMIQKGEITDGLHLSPLYLKKSQAERELEAKNDN